MYHGQFKMKYRSLLLLLGATLMSSCQTPQGVSLNEANIQAPQEENKWSSPEGVFTPLEFLAWVLKVAEAGLDTPEHFEKAFRVKLDLVHWGSDHSLPSHRAKRGRQWFFDVTLVTPADIGSAYGYQGSMTISLTESKTFCLNGWDAQAFVLSRGWEKRRDMILEATGTDGTYFAKRMQGHETSLYMSGRCIARIELTNRSLKGA